MASWWARGTPRTLRLLGYNDVTWYVKVVEGALVGNYQFAVTLEGGNTPRRSDHRVRLRSGVSR